MTCIRNSVAIALVILLLGSVAGTQITRDTPVPLIPESMTGRDAFERLCASCHGLDGRGDGPATVALRTRPTDLTLLARRQGGTFPREKIAGLIEGKGRPVPAHGSGDMPVWGPILHGLDTSDARVRLRLANLVAYLESLQAGSDDTRAAAPQVPAGAGLFRSYCASCHGSDGRGAGPAAQALRELPPDLTQYALLNNGVFPSERLRQIIDGRHVAAHGSMEMPVWGEVFMRERGGDDATAVARIDALVRYLESIQKRRAE